MKKVSSAILITLFILLQVFTFSSCDKSEVLSKFVKINPDIDNENFVILVPRSGGYNNLKVTNSSGKVVYTNAELRKQQILILPNESYYFTATDLRPSKLLQITEDCKVIYEDNSFKIQKLTEPTPVLFLDSRKIPIDSKNLKHGSSYYLSILNLKDLDYDLEYSATARLKDNPDKIYLFKKMNIDKNRLISDNTNNFIWSSVEGTVTVLVNQATGVIKPISFRVIEPQPFAITILNIWKDNNKPIEWAELNYFKISKDDEKIFKNKKMDDMEYKSKKAQGNYGGEIVYTNNEGKIITPKNIRENDIIAIAISVPANSGPDRLFIWYIQTIEAYESNKDKEEIIWAIPAKLSERPFSIPIHSSSIEKWKNVNQDSPDAKLYYIEGKANNNITKKDIMNNLSKYNTVESTRSDRQGNTFVGWFNLSNICAATRINFLIEVSTSEGVFIMDYTSYEEKSTHEYLRLED